MKARLGFLLVIGCVVPATADTLYKCTTAEGRIVYTNQKVPGNCLVVSQDKPVSTFSPPPMKPRQATPADFPRVESAQQRSRDAERRTILEQELANEVRMLEAARKNLQEQEAIIAPEDRIMGGGVNLARREERLRELREKVQLHERNIEALKKELANLK
ncbi:MAG: DUF4124 domain-containing protein [Rhodocyclaceae bacterium]|nr:DUF4124 domain-containing protein [Rhodocyclaceae bacterium]